MIFHGYYRFEWDRKKDIENIKKHKISFHEARTVFEINFSLLTEIDETHSKDEQRYKTTGYCSKGRLLIISHTDRGDAIRIISARKANKSEMRKYHDHLR